MPSSLQHRNWVQFVVLLVAYLANLLTCDPALASLIYWFGQRSIMRRYIFELFCSMCVFVNSCIWCELVLRISLNLKIFGVLRSIFTVGGLHPGLCSWVVLECSAGHRQMHAHTRSSPIYSANRNILSLPPEVLWQFFHNGWEFLNETLHTRCLFVSTLHYKIVFNYLYDKIMPH